MILLTNFAICFSSRFCATTPNLIYVFGTMAHFSFSVEFNIFIFRSFGIPRLRPVILWSNMSLLFDGTVTVDKWLEMLRNYGVLVHGQNLMTQWIFRHNGSLQNVSPCWDLPEPCKEKMSICWKGQVTWSHCSGLFFCRQFKNMVYILRTKSLGELKVNHKGNNFNT